MDYRNKLEELPFQKTEWMGNADCNVEDKFRSKLRGALYNLQILPQVVLFQKDLGSILQT